MRNIWYLILIFCLMPSLVYAQAKPKRDTSKDKSVILLKKQKEETGSKVIPVERNANYRKVHVAKQSKRKASNKRRHTAARKYSASYLTVNRQSLSLSSILAQNGGRLTFDVNTDGKKWVIISLPSWCKVIKYSNCFMLEYGENSSRDERKDWFVVKCDSKEVRVNLSQPAMPYEFAANIYVAYIKHNVYSSSLGCLCMEIHATVTITGAVGEPCSVDAYIVDKKGLYVTAKTGYSSYMLSSSNSIVCSSAKVIPSTNKTQSYDVVCLLPNNALDLRKKKNELCCKVMFWHYGKGYLTDVTYPIYFKAKSKHGTVTTEGY